MTAGSEVVEDYSHVGLTLRQHPLAFLRADLAHRRILTCAAAVATRDRRRVDVAGLVLVRQRPGSAKGVMFMTVEDETGVANIVIWQKTFEVFRRIVLGSSMIGVRGQVQREGEVVHIIAHHLADLSAELASIGSRDGRFALPQGRGDEFPRGSPEPDPRGIVRARDLATAYGHLDEIKVKTRDFR